MFQPPSPQDGALARAVGGAGTALDHPLPPQIQTDGEAGGNTRDLLVKIIGLALKHKILIGGVLAISLFLGMLTTFLMTKIYSGTTTIKIDRNATQIIKESGQASDNARFDPQFYDTQYELIKSRMLAEKVATALNLGQTDFGERPPGFTLSSLLGRGAAPKVEQPAGDLLQRQARAVGLVMDGLTVQPVNQSSIVRIKYSSTSPEWAQKISVAVAEQYQKMTLDMRFSSSNYARNFLEERLQEVKLKLETSEKQLVAYAQKEGLVDADNKQPQVNSELQGVQSAYSSAVAARVLLEQQWRQAESDGGGSLPQVMSDSVIQGARGRLAQLRASYQDKLTTLKPGFPEMLALQNQINSAEKDVRTQIGLIKGSIKSQFDNAAANETALGKKLGELRSQALDLRGRSIDYTILQRDVDTNRSLYDGLLKQFSELGVSGDATSNNVSVIDRAQSPVGPDRPILALNLLIALFLGALAAAGITAVIEVLDDTFKSPEDIETALGVTVLGVTPRYLGGGAEKSALAEVMDDPMSPLAEAYRSLRTAIQFSTSEGAPRSLLVTSSRPKEGKSTSSSSLALNFAQLGMRVLLIDADMRNPSMHKNLSLDNSAGLSNYLAGADVAGLFKTCAMKGVVVMTTGPLPPNPAELLAGPRFGVLLNKASSMFDIVIIDGPPIMGLADAPILGSVCEGTILVVESGGTRRAIVRDALKRLQFSRSRVIGALLNKYDARKHGASYGYGYGASYSYNYSYGGGADKFIYGEKQKAVPSAEQNDAQPSA